MHSPPANYALAAWPSSKTSPSLFPPSTPPPRSRFPLPPCLFLLASLLSLGGATLLLHPLLSLPSIRGRGGVGVTLKKGGINNFGLSLIREGETVRYLEQREREKREREREREREVNWDLKREKEGGKGRWGIGWLWGSGREGMRECMGGKEGGRGLAFGKEGRDLRRKVMGVVGIQTAIKNRERREALRATWLGSTPEDLERLEVSTGLVFRFIIGHSQKREEEREIEEETKQYRDIVRIDLMEEYHKLNQKTIKYFKAIYELFDADYYVKADDDIYLRPDRLGYLLARDRSYKRVYIGCMKTGPVVKDPKFKWFEPKAHLLGSEYFLHAYGPIYALSQPVVSTLSLLPEDSLRLFMNEDVMVGAWMLALSVAHEDCRAMCEPECTKQSVAVWDIPTCSGLCDAPTRLPELHKMDICSKSPTVPE